MAAGGGWQYLLVFAAGCLAAPWLPALPGWTLWLTLLILAAGGLAFRTTCLAATCLLGGLWFTAAAQWQLDSEWPSARDGSLVSVTGTLVELPQRYDQSERFLLAVDRSESDPDVPELLLVSWYRPSERLQPGSRWSMQLELDPPTGRLNPGGFDYRRYLLSRRIGATARVRGEPERLAAESLRGQVDRKRQRLADIIQAETVDLDVAALKRALGVADRSGLRPELSQRLRQTGTAHLLAISGLHIGMVAGIAGLLISLLAAPLVLVWKRLDRRRLAVLGGLLAAFGYAALAGFTLPTQRALIMLGVAAMALLARRAVAPGHALLLALIAVLLFDPLAPLATGFWLSFAAVAVLIWAFAWRPAGDGRWLTGLLRAQMIVMIGLLPLNVGLFGQLIPGALLANLVAIPLVGLVVLPALLLDIGSMLAGLPASAAGVIADWGLSRLLVFLDWLHGIDWAFVPHAGGGGLALLLAAAGALWLLAPVGWPARWLGATLMLPLLLPPTDRPDQGELDVHFLDVGSGLAVLVDSGDETLLYDTGPGDGEGGDLISRILPGLLVRIGSDGLDRVVISHDHRGHAGGAASVTANAAGSPRIYAPEPGPGQACVRGTLWRSGGYRFHILHPSPGLPDLGPNSSCVLQVSGPGGSLLLTGGIDADVEARLLLDQPALTADVLQLPASGHRRGGSSGFLQALSPHLALASVARFDRYDRVHEELQGRLAAAGIRWWSTGRCGALRIRFRPEQAPRVSSMATESRRFWRDPGDCP